MWALENQTPFAVERTWVRDAHGAEVWIVAVKGTYLLHPDGTTQLAEKQEDICRVPVYRGLPGRSSLLYESDLVHTKVATDVLLHGSAYAPRGEPTKHVDVTMTVAGMSKTVRVFGDRRWYKALLGLMLSPPEPFVKMPLVYERAYGGIDRHSEDPQRHAWEPRNPVGTGFAVTARHLDDQLAPNLERPGSLIRTWDQRPAPAGFGPIPRDWAPRLKLAGTYDARWFNERRPLLPLDFDDRFYQAASEDQCTSFLRGGEVVQLTNLTPGGQFRFHLPRVRLGFATNLAGNWRYHRPRLHTVVIEPDTLRLIMVWHTMLACHHDVHNLLLTRVFEKQRLH